MTQWLAPLRRVRKDHLALGIFTLLFALSTLVLGRRFYHESTQLVPAAGGTYIEGSVGTMQPLIPWFTVTNDVNRDIVSLVFSGLLKYNPETKKIEEDLASLQISGDGRMYTLTLKEGLKWHDSTEESPHFVTADDVLFTFQTMQDPQFPQGILRQNFRGVTIEKLGERTVRFKLEQPYRFFASNLTLGLMPKSAFEGVPIAKLDQVLDFGFHPIGAGPYAFKGLIQTELSTEVTLERFERPLPTQYHLERVVFRIFSDYPTLLSDIRTLDGVRLVAHDDKGNPIVPRSFTALNYTLPQYVALFFNLDRPVLQDIQLRLGLQLGTNKQAIVDAIGEKAIVDTPLIEIAQKDWRYQFDPAAAQGALFESDWHLPEKIRLQRLLEQKEANDVGILKMDPIVLLDTGAVLTVTGPSTGIPGVTLNGLPLKRHPTQSGSWIVALPTHRGGTGAIKLGENLLRLSGPGGRIVDSFYVWRTTDAQEFKRATDERGLLQQFLDSRAGTNPESQRITIQDLYVERGFLRRRLSTDPRDVRLNGKGQRLTLKLLTSPAPPQYRTIAENIQKQWADLGVQVVLDIPEARKDFEEKLLKRDYDVLLFGQSLLDNLDSYPYWHTSGVQKVTGNRNDLRLDAYNLSQYSSFRADSLLETSRQTADEKERANTLTQLQDVLKKDVPAIFLYSPTYTFAYTQDLHGVVPGQLSLHSDRYLTLQNWYLKEGRQFTQGRSWLSFFPWLARQL